MGRNVKFDTVMNGELHCLGAGLSILNFRDCFSISHTKYRSEFGVIGEHEKIDPEESAKLIIEQLTGIKFSGENVQQKLF